jgi:hypothetical protein
VAFSRKPKAILSERREFKIDCVIEAGCNVSPKGQKRKDSVPSLRQYQISLSSTVFSFRSNAHDKPKPKFD